MSNDQQQQQQQHQTIESEDPTSTVEEDEIQDLQQEVREMAEKILDFRRRVPDLLKKTLESSLISSRPVLPRIDPVQAGIGADRDSGENIEFSKQALLAEEDPETAAKICVLKSKITSNVSSLPVIMKRMNECMAAIDKLDRCNVDIHPAFKRKRPQ